MPMDSAPVRAAAIRGFDCINRLGESRAVALLRSVDIDLSATRWQERYISYRSVMELLDGVADRHDLPNLGLMLAEHEQQDVTMLGALGVAMQNARTAREGFKFAEKHLSFHSPVAVLKMHPAAPNSDFLSFDIDMDIKRATIQTFELSIAVTNRIARNLIGRDYKPREVWFRHAPVSPLSEYRRIFGITPKFEMTRNGLLISSDQLDTSISGRNELLSELAEHYILSQKAPSFSDSRTEVRRLISNLIQTEPCTEERVSELMRMSVRTMQRRLRDENTTFEEILDNVRRGLAEHYLNHTNLCLSLIAERLHFKESSGLTRACNRWFGFGPKQLREKLRERGDIQKLR
jgi:AraC-like DNA-binding protein